MKHSKLPVKTWGYKNKPQVLYTTLITVLALFLTSGLAQSFNGFASYQDYLNNYYATQNARSNSVDPCGYQGLLSLFVYGNNNCVPNTYTPRTYTSPYLDTTPFNGYPSYQAYLDAFYAGTTSPRTQPASYTNDYYHYSSYDDYIAAVYGNNNLLPGRSGITPNSDYYRYNSYDEFIAAVYGNNATLGPRVGTLPPSNPIPSTSTNGYFEFAVGQSYQFSNGLIMTVQTLNDNRCPINVQCVWQGDIAATVRLAMGNDIQTVTVSMVEGREAPQVVVNNASIQFVGLGQNNMLNTFISIN